MNTAYKTVQPPPSRRRGLRFSIRAMLIFIAAASLILTAHVRRIQSGERQKKLVEELFKEGVITQYEYVQDKDWKSGHKWYPEWLERWVGRDYLYSVDCFVIVQHRAPDRLIEKVADLPYLRLVKLPACTITDESLRPLQTLKRLEWLELFKTPATDNAVAIVAKIKSLKTLDLRGTRVTDACVSELISLPNLQNLYIGNTAITSQAVDQIRAAVPSCEVDTKLQ